MTNLNEYKIEIKNDEDLEKWRSTWKPGDFVPTEVITYMKEVVMPRHVQRVAEILSNDQPWLTR